MFVSVIDFRFRWDYFDKYHEKTGGELVGFQKFMEAGVHSEYLESVFPAESFPAWQTIQTGVFLAEKLSDNWVHSYLKNFSSYDI